MKQQNLSWVNLDKLIIKTGNHLGVHFWHNNKGKLVKYNIVVLNKHELRVFILNYQDNILYLDSFPIHTDLDI